MTKDFNEGLPDISAAHKTRNDFNSNFKNSKKMENGSRNESKGNVTFPEFTKTYKEALLHKVEEFTQRETIRQLARLRNDARRKGLYNRKNDETIKRLTNNLRDSLSLYTLGKALDEFKKSVERENEKRAKDGRVLRNITYEPVKSDGSTKGIFANEKGGIKSFNDMCSSINAIFRAGVLSFGLPKPKLTKEERDERKAQERLEDLMTKAKSLLGLGLELAQVLQYIGSTENVTSDEIKAIEEALTA